MYTLFLCKSDIIEPSIDYSTDDDTTITTPCGDSGIEDCWCIEINEDRVCVDQGEISSDGTISETEQARLYSLYPIIIFSMGGKRFNLGSTQVTFSNQYSPSIHTRQTLNRVVTGSGSNTFTTENSGTHGSEYIPSGPDGFFTDTNTNTNTINTSTTPVVVEQESSDIMIYYIISLVLLIIGAGTTVFLINKNKGEIQRAGRMAGKNIRANRSRKTRTKDYM